MRDVLGWVVFAIALPLALPLLAVVFVTRLVWLVMDLLTLTPRELRTKLW